MTFEFDNSAFERQIRVAAKEQFDAKLYAIAAPLLGKPLSDVESALRASELKDGFTDEGILAIAKEVSAGRIPEIDVA